MRTRRTVVWAGIGAIGVATAAFVAGRAAADGIPAGADAMIYSGVLENAQGEAFTGAHEIAIELWSHATSTTSTERRCEVPPATLQVEKGRFAINLGTGCTDAVKAYPNLWAQIRVDGNALPRTKLGVVPYAVEAGHAVSANTATTAANASAAAGALLTTLNAKADRSAVAITTAWQSYPCALYDTASPAADIGSGSCMYRRVGDSAELKAVIQFPTPPPAASGALGLRLPAGLTVETTKIPSRPGAGTVTVGAVGSGWVYGAAVNQLSTFVVIALKGHVRAFFTGAPWDLTTTNPYALQGGEISFSATVPITGWSANP
jgi:hypothetical protein